MSSAAGSGPTAQAQRRLLQSNAAAKLGLVSSLAHFSYIESEMVHGECHHVCHARAVVSSTTAPSMSQMLNIKPDVVTRRTAAVHAKTTV